MFACRDGDFEVPRGSLVQIHKGGAGIQRVHLTRWALRETCKPLGDGQTSRGRGYMDERWFTAPLVSARRCGCSCTDRQEGYSRRQRENTGCSNGFQRACHVSCNLPCPRSETFFRLYRGTGYAKSYQCQ